MIKILVAIIISLPIIVLGLLVIIAVSKRAAKVFVNRFPRVWGAPLALFFTILVTVALPFTLLVLATVSSGAAMASDLDALVMLLMGARASMIAALFAAVPVALWAFVKARRVAAVKRACSSNPLKLSNADTGV